MNMYAYVGNDPVNNTDPTGKCPQCISGGIGALIGGAVGGISKALTGGSAKEILAATLGGATTGAIIGSTGNVAAAQYAGALVESTSGQLLESGTVDISQTISETAVNGSIGKFVPGAKVPGLNASRGSLGHVARTQKTNLLRGNTSSVSTKTAAKIGANELIESSSQVAAQGASDAIGIPDAGSGLLDQIGTAISNAGVALVEELCVCRVE